MEPSADEKHRKLFAELGGSPPELDEEEDVLHEGPANLFRRHEGAGGWLWLTTKRLVFRPHQVTAATPQEVWAIADVEMAEPVKTMWVLRNGLVVWLQDRRSVRFVVEKHEQWAAGIREAVEQRKAKAYGA